MTYVAILALGLVTGALCVALAVMDWYKKVRSKEQEADLLSRRAREDLDAAAAREKQLAVRKTELDRREGEFNRRLITYQELENENHILKRDLQNIDVNLHKLELDHQVQAHRQKELDQRSTSLAERYLNETIKAVVAQIGPSNFSACKQRLVDTIGRCREIGFEITAAREESLLADLRKEFETAVRAAFEREEQGRIKAQIREEERLKREIDRELKQLDRERAAIQAALDQALAAAEGRHTAEVERLQARLAEAEEKSRRALSMAQQTKAGHVYIISNIGSFGSDVFKIGMTRRLQPQERVDELGCAAVPFPFDVHMMIHSEDAPRLENALHRAFYRCRINKANPRKEFFRVKLEEICKIVKEHCGEIQYVADPEALEYRQSLEMPQEDSEFIEKVYDAVEEETALPEDF